jgi:hypothetical protein
MTGSITPNDKALEAIGIFWEVHKGVGHSSVEPSQCYQARRREEMKAARVSSEDNKNDI